MSRSVSRTGSHPWGRTRHPDNIPGMGSNVLTAIIQKSDDKARRWADESRKYGLALIPIEGSPVRMPWVILGFLLRRKRLDAIIIRYLNDYPSLLRTLLRTLAELLVIGLCTCLRIRLIWICHNVDRESDAYHRRISRWRRTAFARVASVVLVTDPGLVKYWKELFPLYQHKVRSLTFGDYVPRPTSIEAEQLTAEIRDFIARRRARTDSKKSVIGLCIGSPSPKVSHFQMVKPLLLAGENYGWDISMIVIGSVSEILEGRHDSELKFLHDDPRVYFYDGRAPVDEEALSKDIDFYWRAYQDLSVPFTLYIAASLRRPILASRSGFLAEAVETYGLGAVVDGKFRDIDKAMLKLSQWEPASAAEFLASHSWDQAARVLVDACRDGM